MTASRIFLPAAAVALVAAVAIYEVREKSILRKRIQDLELRATLLTRQINDLRRERDGSASKLETLIRENRQLRPAVDGKAPAEPDEGVLKIASLKEVLARLPEHGIPEIQFATDGDWHTAVDGNLDTVDDYRRALAKLRNLALGRFAPLMHLALRSYLRANNGQFPTEPSQLQPFFNRPTDSAILQRYKVVPAEEVRNVRVGGAWAITQAAVIDADYDSRFVVGPDGHGSFTKSANDALVESLVRAYAAAHGGEKPPDIPQLMPFATTPEQRAALERMHQEAKR